MPNRYKAGVPRTHGIMITMISVLTTTLSLACGAGDGTAMPSGTTDDTSSTPTPTSAPASAVCSTYAEGCPCTEANKTEACKKRVVLGSGYVMCSNGETTCRPDTLTWSDCVGGVSVTESEDTGATAR